MLTNKNILYYIYQLPHAERRELCRILDQNNKWEELGGTYMQYDVLTMQDLRKEIIRGNSPSDELLTMWGHQNHTVSELFILLSRMQHYQAMSVIKKFVDKKYHALLDEGEQNLNRLVERLSLDKQQLPCIKNLGIPNTNFNQNEKILNVDLRRPYNNVEQLPKINVNQQAMVSREDNVSTNNVRHIQLLKPKSPIPLGRVGPSHGLMASEISYVAESAGAIPQIPYDELQTATYNWDINAILGRGGFGTVFKGVWKCTQVAIKRIEQKADNPESHSEQIKQSITELHCLNAYRHDNVLPLYGYSIGGAQPCLVYQYMSGGCLEKRLRVRNPANVLSWPKRLNIAIGTARGLQFLHTIGEKPLVHGDIKSANILLDPTDNAKIGDFGLAREGPRSDYTHIKVSRIHGTRPYLPDEFLRAKKFSTKVDTYSFGIVLFEIATALSAYSDQRPHKFLRDHVVNFEGNDICKLKDIRMEGGEHCFKRLIDIGKLCVSEKAKDRPEMRAVLILLEGVGLF